jgi:uncharacterized membrane protein
MKKPFKVILLILAFFGLIISLYLVYEYSQPTDISCPLKTEASFNCESVKDSSYSTFLGVMLPIWGSLYYTFLILLISVSFIEGLEKNKNEYVKKLNILKQKYYEIFLFIILLWGVLFEGYNTFIAITKIDAVCFWCLLVEIIVNLMFFVLIAEWVVNKRKKVKVKSNKK